MIYLGPALQVLALILFFIAMIKALKKKLPERKDILNKELNFYNKIESYISKIKLLNKVKEELQLRYGVINSSPESKNRISAVKTIWYISILSIISIIVTVLIIKIWHMVIFIALGIICFPYIILFMILGIKLNKLKRQFPEGLNTFITKYTSEKNKDRALSSTYLELDNPIRYEFKRLSTMMANKSNVFEAVKSFSRRVNYIWAEVFGELLILNHTEVNDIGEQLNELGILISEDQSLEAHKKAEISGTKAVNVIVALFVPGAVLFNSAFFKTEAIKIYFESYLGRVSVSVAFITVVICIALTFYFEKN